MPAAPPVARELTPQTSERGPRAGLQNDAQSCYPLLSLGASTSSAAGTAAGDDTLWVIITAGPLEHNCPGRYYPLRETAGTEFLAAGGRRFHFCSPTLVKGYYVVEELRAVRK